jgi:hypothetical protein
MGLQAMYRAAAVTLLTECAANANVTLQVYPGRPASVYPPTAFIDGMGDELTPTPGASDLFTHAPSIEILCLWGLLDSKEAVDQRDAFVDAFHDWIRTRHDEVSGATLIAPRSLSEGVLRHPDHAGGLRHRLTALSTSSAGR